MDILKKLTPAETKLLIQPDCQLSELLKYTLMDLLMRQILKTQLANEIVPYHQFSTGVNFRGYHPRMHESLFTRGFDSDYDMVLSLYEIEKLIRVKYTNTKDFIWNFFIEPRISEYFKNLPSGFLRRFSKIGLNAKGESMKEELEDVFSKLENQFSSNISSENIAEIYSNIGTNVLLLKFYTYDELSNLFENDKKEKRQYEVVTYPGDTVTVYYSDSTSNSEEDENPGVPLIDPNIIHEILESIENAADSISDTFGTSLDTSNSSSSWSGDGSGSGFFGGLFDGDSGWGDSGGDSGCSGCGGCGGD